MTSAPVQETPLSPGQSHISGGDAFGSRGMSLGDVALGFAARSAAATILIMMGALVLVLALNALPTIRTIGPAFLVGSDWRPNELERPLKGADGAVVMKDGEIVLETVPPSFGALPVIFGTVVSSILALAFAIPLSFAAALFIVRVAPSLRLAAVISFLVELLAAIPSLAYGIWGLFVLGPFVQNHLGPVVRYVLGGVPGLHFLFFQQVKIGDTFVERPIPITGASMFTGSLILGIMVLPIITSVSRDVLKSVPRMQIEGTLALGATWWQSCWAMLLYARSGLFGAVMLGLARASGETMAITMAIGNNNQISPSIFAPAQTMASLLANEFAEAEPGLHISALLSVALILLVMSLAFNIVARYLVVGSGSKTSAAH